MKLEAEQHRDLAGRQRRARSARTYRDELGMGHIHLVLEPHRYAPIAARAEAEAARLAKAAKAAAKEVGRGRNAAATEDGGPWPEPESEPFERYLAGAYAALLSPIRGGGTGGKPTGRAQRPELVVLVSHGVATRGWTDVKPDEVCKIPGVGRSRPESPGRSRRMPF